MKLCCRFLLASGLFLGAAQSANAAEVTRVASSFEEGNVFDFHFGVAYSYNFKRAAILREWNRGQTGDNENRLVKDLIYRQQRHIITPMMEIGLWHDLAVYVELPVVAYDTRSYSFDQRADDCVFGDGVPPAPEATCVNKNNSTTIRDGIIPRDGFDATDTDFPYAQFTGPDTELIFQGPARRGLDQLHLGLKYGILNQDTRPHMPTWIIAAEGRFAVGRAMSFSRDVQVNDPAGNHRVGRRIHELGLWTALSRRHLFLDPFFKAWWRQAIRAANSKFQDFGGEGAQGEVGPMSTAGLAVGTEVVPWERKAKNLKVAVLLQGSAILHYGGRGYSEVWELLADSPALAGSYDPTTQRVNDMGDPVNPGAFCSRARALAFAEANPGDPGYLQAGGGSCQKFEGITDIQDYGTFGFTGGLNLDLGKYTHLMLGVNVNTDTRHFVTFTGRGDADGGGNDPDVVEPGTREVNPLRRDVVDSVGRRYVVDDVVDMYAYLRLLLTF